MCNGEKSLEKGKVGRIWKYDDCQMTPGSWSSSFLQNRDDPKQRNVGFPEKLKTVLHKRNCG